MKQNRKKKKQIPRHSINYLIELLAEIKIYTIFDVETIKLFHINETVTEIGQTIATTLITNL